MLSSLTQWSPDKETTRFIFQMQLLGVIMDLHLSFLNFLFILQKYLLYPFKIKWNVAFRPLLYLVKLNLAGTLWDNTWITNLRLQPYLPGTNELKNFSTIWVKSWSLTLIIHGFEHNTPRYTILITNRRTMLGYILYYIIKLSTELGITRTAKKLQLVCWWLPTILSRIGNRLRDFIYRIYIYIYNMLGKNICRIFPQATVMSVPSTRGSS